MTFAEYLQAVIDERLHFVAQHRERLIEAWVAETGCLPSEAELVEQRAADGTVVVRVRRRA